jgi:hypothetical protein
MFGDFVMGYFDYIGVTEDRAQQPQQRPSMFPGPAPIAAPSVHAVPATRPSYIDEAITMGAPALGGALALAGFLGGKHAVESRAATLPEGRIASLAGDTRGAAPVRMLKAGEHIFAPTSTALRQAK